MKNEPPLSTLGPSVNKDSLPMDLRSLRESKGISLKDVFSVTRITVTNLEAIENGQFHLLPEPVYTRTFIRTYAGLLGIDSHQLLQQYENYLTSRKAINAVKEETQQEQPRQGKKKAIFLGILFVIILLGLVAAIVLIDVNDLRDLFSSSPTSQQKIDQIKKIDSPAGIPAPAPTQPPAEAVSPPPAGQGPATQDRGSSPPLQPLKIKFEATERTWIRINADEKKGEQFILNKGDLLERTARESLLVDIGNTGGVKVWFQEQPLPDLGKRGEVKHLKFP